MTQTAQGTKNEVRRGFFVDDGCGKDTGLLLPISREIPTSQPGSKL